MNMREKVVQSCIKIVVKISFLIMTRHTKGTSLAHKYPKKQ